MKEKSLLFFIALFALLIQCSFMDSMSGSISRSVTGVADATSAVVGSLSKSVSSISESISSGEDKAKTAYREDVRTLMGLYAKAGSFEANWEADFSRLAKDHGILNWKSNANTYLAIGEACKELGLSETELNGLLSKKEISLSLASLVKKGYSSF